MRLIAPVMIGTLAAVLGLPQAASSGETATEAPNSSPANTANAVEVHIGAVLASNSGKDFDPRLVSLHRQFNVLFPYTSYRLVKEQRMQVPWGGKVGFDIPGGRYVLVIPKEFKNDRVCMKVMLIDGERPIVDTSLSLKNHATFLVAGPRHAEGVLILSIGADTHPVMRPPLLQLIDRALAGWTEARRWLAFWGPVTTAPALVGVLVALTSVVTLALLTGIAVASLATLLVAVFVLYLLLTDVFGVSIDVNVP